MKKEMYFAKSFEEDFVLKTLRGKKKINFQSIANILKTKTIKPNTKSFGREMRLACSFLHKNYLKTYRPHGLIFQTKNKPNFMYPFNLVLLSDSKKIVVHYYKIKNNLHMHYNHNLISGFEQFVFSDINKMLKRFDSPKKSWKEVNKFRIKALYERLPKQKYRLVEYNEIIFHKPIKIRPIAIFGYRKNSRKIARKYGLPHFVTAKKFYESLKKL